MLVGKNRWEHFYARWKKSLGALLCSLEKIAGSTSMLVGKNRWEHFYARWKESLGALLCSLEKFAQMYGICHHLPANLPTKNPPYIV